MVHLQTRVKCSFSVAAKERFFPLIDGFTIILIPPDAIFL